MHQLLEEHQETGLVPRNANSVLNSLSPDEVASTFLEKEDWEFFFPKFNYPDPRLADGAFSYANTELLEFLKEIGWKVNYIGTKHEDPEEIVSECKNLNLPFVSFELTKEYVIEVGAKEILKHGIVPHVNRVNFSVEVQLAAIKRGIEEEDWGNCVENPFPLEQVVVWTYYNDKSSLRTQENFILLAFASPDELTENYGLKRFTVKERRGEDYINVSKVKEGIYYLEDSLEAQTLSYDILEEFENFFDVFQKLSVRMKGRLAFRCREIADGILQTHRYLLTMMTSNFFRGDLTYTLEESYYIFNNNYFVRNTSREPPSKEKNYCGFFFDEYFAYDEGVTNVLSACGSLLGLDLIVIRNHYGMFGVTTLVVDCR